MVNINFLEIVNDLAKQNGCVCDNSYVSDEGYPTFKLHCEAMNHNFEKTCKLKPQIIICKECEMIKAKKYYDDLHKIKIERNNKIIEKFERDEFTVTNLNEKTKRRDTINVKCKHGHLTQLTLNYILITMTDPNYKCCECENIKKLNDIEHIKDSIFSEKNDKLVEKFKENEFIILNLTRDSKTSDLINIKCKNNHVDKIQLKSIRNLMKRSVFNHKCTECNYINILNDVKQISIDRGGTCLSPFYKPNEKLEFKCYYNHTWFAFMDTIKYKLTWCPKCNIHINEEITRKIFETLFNVEFIKIKPKWLNGYELDGFSEQLGICYEYDGPQHFIFIKYWHKTIEGLHEQQERDRKKDLLCKEQGVILIRIPYTVKTNDLQEYIMNKCLENNINVNYNKKMDLTKFTDIYKNNDKKFENLLKMVTDKKGTTDAKVYVNYEYKINVTCEHGHVFETYHKNLKNGSWCPKCYRPQKTLKDMHELAQKNRGKCLSTIYVDRKSILSWECDKGHRWDCQAQRVIANYWCPKCSRVLKHENIFQCIQELALKNGGKCVSVNYINRKSILSFECKKGHCWNTQALNIIAGHWCPRCAKEKPKNTLSKKNIIRNTY